MIRLSTFYILFFLSLNAFSNTSGFDANDVSFLFPLSSGRPYPAVNINEGPVLIDEDLFKQVLQFEHSVNDLTSLPYLNARFLSDRNQWFVTSFRFEDCGNSLISQKINDPIINSEVRLLTRTNQCQANLRIVIQPFNFSDQPLPTAMHLIFNIDVFEELQVINQLLEIKKTSSQLIRSDGRPLMVHPGLDFELNSNTTKHQLSDKIRNFLFTTLTLSGRTPRSRLDVLTMTINSAVMGWKMVGGRIENNKWIRFVTPFNRSLYDPNGSEGILLGVEEIQCNFYDYCYSLPNKIESANRGLLTTGFKKNADGTAPAPLRNTETEILAEYIDNPRRTHFFNTNCLSCHESSNFRNRKNIWTDLEHPSGITPFTIKKLTSDSSSNVINFGYEGVTARISTRTASETADVADRLNRFLKLKNPSPQYSDLSLFWTCLMNENNYLKCLTN